MRELQGLSLKGLEWSDVDIFSIPYKDPSRNKQWMATMQARREKATTEPAASSLSSSASSRNGGRGGSRGGSSGGRRDGRSSASSRTLSALDLDELDEDWREYKRMKKGEKAHP